MFCLGLQGKSKGQREIGDFIGACSSPVFLLGAVAFP